MQSIPFTITPSGIVMFVNNVQASVPQDHPNYSKIKDAILSKAWTLIPDLIDVRSSVKKWIVKDGRFVLENDRLTLNNIPFSDVITDKVLNMIEAGNSPDALFNFLLKTRQNPSKVAQDELLLFCVANGFMIHEDGDILAYKSVRNDYTDIHSGTFKNTIGSTQKMERNQVDDRRENTCSNGLHFASYEYASTWTSWGHLMLIKLNPKDVVSIPHDYDNQKGRTCRYVVFGEVTAPLPMREVYTNDEVDGFNEVTDTMDFESENRCDCGCNEMDIEAGYCICDINNEVNADGLPDDLISEFRDLLAKLRNTKNSFARREKYARRLTEIADELDGLEVKIPQDLENQLASSRY